MATMNRLQATSDKFNAYAICNSVMTVQKNKTENSDNSMWEDKYVQ